jgi:hypothetical protein
VAWEAGVEREFVGGGGTKGRKRRNLWPVEAGVFKWRRSGPEISSARAMCLFRVWHVCVCLSREVGMHRGIGMVMVLDCNAGTVKR